MKVTFYIPSLDHGGPDRVFFKLVTGLTEAGWDVTLLVDVAGGFYWDQLGPEVRKQALVTGEYNGSTRYPVKAFTAYVRSEQPDLVVCTLRSVLTATAAKYLGRLSVPLIIRPANHITRNSLELLRQNPLKHGFSWVANMLSLHTADHVVCQSQDLYDDFRRYGVPETKLTIIGNPITLPTDEQVAAWQAQRGPGKPSLVAVGRLMSQKGFDLLIKAVARLKESLPDLRLTIFGEGEDRPVLEGLIQEHGLQDRVLLPGFSKQVHAHVASADFLVSASRYEGFPNVVLEALSAGVPVIATNCPGGTRELVFEGRTGWLCAPNSEEALAQAILAAWSAAHRPGYRDIRQFVIDNYTTSKVTERYADVLKLVAARHGR